MTHPHLLHARRALWDLYDLWPQLVQAERAEHHRLSRAAYGNATHDGVRSTATGTRSVGTHSDPVAVAVLAGVDERPNRYAVLRGRQLETLTWLEQRVAGTNMQIIGPCTGFFSVLHKLAPSVAADLARWIDEISTRVREALEAPPAAIVVTGVSCPACGVRLLYGHVSGPRDAWTITCRPDCLCTGETCACGMDQPNAGVVHIWHAGRWQDQLDTARAKIGAA